MVLGPMPGIARSSRAFLRVNFAVSVMPAIPSRSISDRRSASRSNATVAS